MPNHKIMLDEEQMKDAIRIAEDAYFVMRPSQAEYKAAKARLQALLEKRREEKQISETSEPETKNGT